MPLELRDLATNKTIEVPDEGLTFGREGGKADVQVKDNGVSKSHARVYADGEAWFLEDLGSANGTYLGEDRLAAPTEIMPNDVISMSKTRFEVVGPIGDEQGGDQDQEREPTPPPAPPPRAAAKAAPAPAAKKPAGKPAGAGPAMSAARKPVSGTVEAGMGDAGPDDNAAAESKGIGYFFIAVPKAIAFYLAAVPLMLVNPIGTIRKGIAEQKHDAKGRMELIAYALPINLFSAAVVFVATVISQLVTRTLNIGGLLVGMLIIPAIVAVVASAITGFIWHPFWNWIMKLGFLKADATDDRSRTNMFLMMMTASGLVALPNGLAILLRLIPLWPVWALSPVISTVASLVTAFVFYSWMKFFNVVKWFQMVCLGLGALTAVSGVLGVVGVLTGPHGGTIVAGSTGGTAEEQIAAAQKQAEEAMKQAEEATGDAKDLIKEGQAAAKKAAADAQAKGNQAQAAGSKTAPPPGKEAAPPPEKVAEPPPRVEKAPPAEKTAPVTGGGYPAFAQMRDAIEKKITDDPTLLTRTPGVQDLYRDFENDVYELDAKYTKGKKPSEARLNAHLRDAELYEKTEKKVKELYGKLNK